MGKLKNFIPAYVITYINHAIRVNEALKIKSLPLAIAMPISGFIQLCFIYYFVKKFNLITKVFFKISNLKQNMQQVVQTKKCFEHRTEVF